MHRITFITLLSFATLSLALQSAGCTHDEASGRDQDAGLELVPISERDSLALAVLEGLRAEPTADGQLEIAWDEVADPNVAFVELWRPNMSKWAELSGGEWNPELDHWGDIVARIPAGPARWLDLNALVLDSNRYILRTIGFAGEVRNGFVVEAREANFGYRAANWSDEDTNGVGTHDIQGEYVNVRGDNMDTVLFTANRGELLTLSYESRSHGAHEYFEVFLKSGPHAGARGWVAKEFLRWSVLDVCRDGVDVRSGDDLGTVIGKVNTGADAYINSGTVRNTGQHRYFSVSVDGLQGWIATSSLCPQGSAVASGSSDEAEPEQEQPSPNPGGSSYDAGAAKRLADEAYAGSVGYSMGRCYEYAWNAMKRAIGITESRANQLGIPAASAYQFGDWADQNPSALRNDFGLQAIDSSAAQAPVGSVIVWDAGQCGFNAIHGHIEIVASPGYACSDFCGYMYNDCGKPRVYMPVK